RELRVDLFELLLKVRPLFVAERRQRVVAAASLRRSRLGAAASASGVRGAAPAAATASTPSEGIDRHLEVGRELLERRRPLGRWRVGLDVAREGNGLHDAAVLLERF